jgi:NTE family protein
VKRILSITLIPWTLLAQTHRPTIGVALEGGGAKGLAHIGVLQWFEEHRIPIDYLAGTSMGGLIGGLYATGRSPAEIREIAGRVDWDQVLAGSVPFRDLSFRRKEDSVEYPNRFVIGLRGGVTLPGGLNSGQAVRTLMDRYVLPYSDRQNFDDLPVPFRCVATDLVTGQPRVYSSGSLAEALRATMSIPAVFAPVRTDGHVLADGGLLDNLPTDVVRKMGADIVIGVHLSVGPTDPKTLRSLISVMGASSGVMIGANELRGIEQSDILITVDVAGYTTLDFSRSGEIVPKGYEAAAGKAALLSRLSLSEQEWSRYLTARESRRIKSVPVPKFVEVEGASGDVAEQIRRHLAPFADRPVDTAALESDLEVLAGLGRFNSLSYSLIDRSGVPGLLITADEKPELPPWIKPAIVIDGADPSNVGFTLSARLTFLDLGGFRSELRADFAFGSEYGIRAEYYHPFKPLGKWFVAPRI